MSKYKEYQSISIEIEKCHKVKTLHLKEGCSSFTINMTIILFFIANLDSQVNL